MSEHPFRIAVAGRVLMVGHLFEYHPGVQRLKQLVDSRELPPPSA